MSEFQSDKFSETSQDEQVRPAPAIATERLRVSSGAVSVIDQYMLANAQFFVQLQGTANEGSFSMAERRAVEKYGGCSFELKPGEYTVYRYPQDSIMIITPRVKSGNESLPQIQEAEELLNSVCTEIEELAPLGSVYVDTRCVVFIDAALLRDATLMSHFAELRHEGQDKEARDLLRENGAAVRYGFNREGDELEVFVLAGPSIAVLRAAGANFGNT